MRAVIALAMMLSGALPALADTTPAPEYQQIAGLIRTPLATALLDNADFMARRLQTTPLRRVGEPHEVAGVVAMLAGRAGGFITGQNLVVDGGTLISDGS